MKRLLVIFLLIGAGMAQEKAATTTKVPEKTALAIRDAQVKVQTYDLLLNGCNARRAKLLEDAREEARKDFQRILEQAFKDAGLDQKTFVLNDEKWQFEPLPKPEPSKK